MLFSFFKKNKILSSVTLASFIYILVNLLFGERVRVFDYVLFFIIQFYFVWGYTNHTTTDKNRKE